MKIVIDEICPACRGTGLYVGLAERDGFAVVCSKCKGTGRYHFEHEYEEFKQRIPRKGIKRVLETNPGIVAGTGREGLTLESFGGLPWKDWNDGKPFPSGSEMRDYTCPAWWAQATDGRGPHWEECTLPGMHFSECPHFVTKGQCWKRLDSESERRAR